MEYKNLILEKEDELAIVKINRPPVNALNSEVVSEIHQMIDELENDEQVKVIILTGEGKAFVAGADILRWRAIFGSRLKARNLVNPR